MAEITSTDTTPKSGKSLLLGLFIVFQIVFLIGMNVIQFIPRGRVQNIQGEYFGDPQIEGQFTSNKVLQGTVNTVGTVFDRYSESTGQFQYWKMFCPKLPTYSIFPRVEVEFENGEKQYIDSVFYKPETTIRLPVLDYHPHHFESAIVSGMWNFTPDIIDKDPQSAKEFYEIWAHARPKTLPYLIEKAVAKSDPTKKPIRATLLLRYTSKLSSSLNVVNHDRPFCRLTLPTQTSPTKTMELYNPVEKRFEPLEQPKEAQ
jgi:hypothetical protein